MKSKRSTGRGVALALGAGLLVSWPALALAGEGGDGELIKTTIFHLINLVALLAGVIYVARGPLSSYLKARKARVMSDIEEARRLHEEARALVDRYEAQIAGLDAERAQILNEYKEIGKAERERIMAAAHKQAAKMTADAERTVALEIQRAKDVLQAEVVRLAAQMAEASIREKLDASRQSRLVDDYIKVLEGSIQA